MRSARHTIPYWLVCVFSASIPSVLEARGDAASLERFFGRYEGELIVDATGEMSKRDMTITIKAYHDGFTMGWTTVRERSDGRIKRKAHWVNFLPTGRSGLYASAAKRDLFGHEVPMDPLEGAPFVWATIAKDTLTLYALLIKDDGSYEMQVYGRTLTERGLDLEFERIEEGQRTTVVRGGLRRIHSEARSLERFDRR